MIGQCKPPAPARIKDAARRWRGRPRRPVLDPRRVGRLGLGMTVARGASVMMDVRSTNPLVPSPHPRI